MNTGIKNWPSSERPRELLLKQGSTALTDASLIAIFLRTGSHGEDALALSRRLLNTFGNLHGLINADQSELRKIKGLGTAKISALLALKEVVSRSNLAVLDKKPSINSTQDVLDYLAVSMRDLQKEIFKVLYLNNANSLLAIDDLPGTVSESIIYPREIVERALNLRATGIIFAHNHPSGLLEPSASDLDLTRRLYAACKAVDIKPLDHLLITQAGHLSLNEFL